MCTFQHGDVHDFEIAGEIHLDRSSIQDQVHALRSLGTFQRFEPGYSAMAFENGAGCWQGPARSIKVCISLLDPFFNLLFTIWIGMETAIVLLALEVVARQRDCWRSAH